jgi:hypothetical protein
MRLRYHAPMPRCLFTLASALSLLLCVGTCVLWAQSYSASGTTIRWGHVGSVWIRGNLVLGRFSAIRGQNTSSGFRLYIEMPCWCAPIGCGGLAMLFAGLVRVRIERQSVAGACIHCGYDLRASPDRCPECGTVPTHRQKSI